MKKRLIIKKLLPPLVSPSRLFNQPKIDNVAFYYTIFPELSGTTNNEEIPMKIADILASKTATDQVDENLNFIKGQILSLVENPNKELRSGICQSISDTLTVIAGSDLLKERSPLVKDTLRAADLRMNIVRMAIYLNGLQGIRKNVAIDGDESIRNLDISTRVINLLHGAKIKTIRALTKESESTLRKIKCFGSNANWQVKNALEKRNLALRENSDSE